MNKKILQKIFLFLSLFFFVSSSFAGGNFLQQKAQKITNNFFNRIEKDPNSKKNELAIYENVAETIYKIINKNKLKPQQKELLKYILEEIVAKINIFDPDYYNLESKKFIGGGSEPFWSFETNGNVLYFTDFSVKNSKKEIYKIIATKAQEEIDLEAVMGPYFEIKEMQCTNDMNGLNYDYTVFVYVGGIKKFTGCANLKK